MSTATDHVDGVRPAWAWVPHTIHYSPGDDFFSDGDILCPQNTRQLVLSIPGEDDDDVSERKLSSFKCQGVDCQSVFTTIREYENHYNSQHRHPCIECRRSFPTSYLLEVHITEWHDPMFHILSSSQHMYRCLLETCSETFSTYHHRRDHMIKIHKYPSNFRFDKPPKDKHQINLPGKKTNRSKGKNDPCSIKASPSNKSPMSLASLAQGYIPHNSHHGNTGNHGYTHTTGTAQHPVNMDTSSVAMDTQTTKEAGRKFYYRATVPKNICFGAGSQRGFHGRGRSRGCGRGRHWHQMKDANSQTERDIEDVNMEELGDALELT